MNMENVLSPGWRTVLGGFLIHLVLGTLYVWANITPSVTSYLRQFDLSVTYDQTIIVYAATIAGQGATMILGGMVSQKLGARMACFLGSFVLVSGTFLASVSTTVAQMIFCQGIMLGIGLGLCYTAPVAAAVRWMPHRKGLVTGIIVGGFGFGAFVFGLLATSVVNPNHLSVAQSGPDAHYFPANSPVVANVPTMFRVLGVTYTFILALGCFLIVEATNSPSTFTIASGDGSRSDAAAAAAVISSKTMSKQPRHRKSFTGTKGFYSAAPMTEDSEHSSEEITSSGSGTNNPLHSSPSDIEMTITGGGFDASSSSISPRSQVHEDSTDLDGSSNRLGKEEEKVAHEVSLTPQELLRTPMAWHIASCFVTTTVGGMYVAGTFKVFGQSQFADEIFLSSIASVSSMFNSGGRIFWGYIADQLGAIQTLLVMSAVFALILLTYPASATMGGEAGFALWTFLVFFCEGANFVLYVPVTVSLFGHQHSASNYGLIFTSHSVFTVLNIFVLAHTGVPFPRACHMMGFLTALGCANVLLLAYHIKYTGNTKRI